MAPKDYLGFFFVFCLCEFAFLVDPILEYNSVHGESSIWYSGYVPTERKYNSVNSRLLTESDTVSYFCM